MRDNKDESLDHPLDTAQAFDEDGYCSVCGYGWWRHTWKHVIFCLAQTMATQKAAVDD